MQTGTISALFSALVLSLPLSVPVMAAPKIIHIEADGSVRENYLVDDSAELRRIEANRATVDRQDEGLPVIVRGPGRERADTDMRIVVIGGYTAQPRQAFPLAPTTFRPTVRRPQVVRPQIVDPGRPRGTRTTHRQETIIFNGGRGQYGDVDIRIGRD